jgi:NAD(P)-dependent dehydrogenase (short-subunit alcohol dehydrogenase family)
VELAPHNIRVNGIAPGYIDEDKKGRPIPHRYTPLHRSSISSLYVGRAAVYLSSEYFSKYTTGSVLKIDAGLSLYNHLLDCSPKGNLATLLLQER